MANKPEVISYKDYNITIPPIRTGEELTNSGASTVILAMIINAAVAIGAGILAYNGGRKKRETHNIFSNGLLMKELSLLDADECIALGFCHISSLKPSQRTFRQDSLLKMIQMNSDEYIWKNIMEPKNIYEFASTIGRFSQTSTEELCTKTFSKCKWPIDQLLKLFPNEENLCMNLERSLQLIQKQINL